MIKLSKKWGYTLKAMIYIAKKNQIVKITDISRDLEISDNLLRRIISDIEKTQIIKTIKWRNWWVILNKNLSDINVYDVLKSVWEDLHITECSAWRNCDREDICQTTSIFKWIQKWFNMILKLYTFDKIIKNEQEK